MAPTSRSSGARAESVPISRIPSAPKPRLIPYVEIPVYRGGLASRGSAPASRASSVSLSGHGSLKRKESEVGPVETPPAKRVRKPRVPGPPITLAERAQSLAAASAKPVSRFLRNAPPSSVASETRSHFKVPDLPARVIRPQRRTSSPQAGPPQQVSSLSVYDFFTDEERRSTSAQEDQPRAGSSPLVFDFTDEEGPNGEPSQRQEGLAQLPNLLSTNGGPSSSQLAETVEKEAEPIQAAQEGPQKAQMPRRGRPRTAPRDAQGNAVKPMTTRQTKAGGRVVTQVVKRKPRRPRLDGGEFPTVVQDGKESRVRTRDLKRAGKKANRKPPTDEESIWEEEQSEDEDQPRGPTTRFTMPSAPLPISRGPPGQVPSDVMAAYTSHLALLQSRTDAGLPQLYAAFQTFWIPRRANYFVLMGGTGSGLPYPAITSQGGGPGSSTAVHLSNPSFFYWDPLALVPGGIRCPANECSNSLQHAGLVKQPKRVYMEGGNGVVVSNDPYVGFWIVAARYKCQNCGVRGTANPKVYSAYVAWDQKILEGLPPLIRSEFPAVEKKKNGKKAFFAAEVALPPEHRMDPQFVSTMLPTQPQPPQQGPSSSAAAEPSGASEALVHPGPSHSTTSLDVGPSSQVENPSPSVLPRAPSLQQASTQAQPLASWSREAEELGDAAGQLFAELLLGTGDLHPEGSGDTLPQAAAGMSEGIGSGNGPNGDSGTLAVESLEISLRVAENGDAPLPAGASTTEHLVQLQGEEVDSTVHEGPSTADAERPVVGSSSHPSGTSIAVVHHVQPHTDIPQPYYPGLDLSSSGPPLRPSPFQTPSSTPTPPVPSTSAAPGPVPSLLPGMHQYYAQFKAPTPQVTAPPSIHFFTPFLPPSASAPGNAIATPIPSWPPTLPPTQPGPSGTVVSSYSTLAGAVTPPLNANHAATALPVPVIGSFNAQSQVVVQVKKRRGPRKCSKCLQLGCKGANGVQYCPNPCIGCKQVDCKKPHTTRGNLCVEGGQSVPGPAELEPLEPAELVPLETAELVVPLEPAELVPLEPSPSNSNSADGSGGPEIAEADVHMHDAEGEPEHEPDSSVGLGTNDILA